VTREPLCSEGSAVGAGLRLGARRRPLPIEADQQRLPGAAELIEQLEQQYQYHYHLV